MACVLQIGAGGVGGVVAHKMASNRESFTRIILASRTLSKCQAIADSIRQKGLGEIEIDSVDADSVESVVALIEKYRPKLVVNVALPYQDLSIMEACLRTKTHYLDTANYEHPDSAHFEYKEQWAYDTRYKQAGIFALLGSGFDPGVTNVFCAYAQKHYFDEIHSIDILDCNAGDHGYAFATNFNPEINLREVSSKARYWTKDIKDSNTESKSLVSQADLALNLDLKQDTIYRKFERDEKHFTLDSNTQDLKVESYFNGQWRDIAPLALMKEWDYPEVGVKNSYLLYHEELESLIRNIKGLRKIRFFMTFGESYLTHMKCLENIGFLRIDEVAHKGGKIVPIEVLKTLLPDPASLASRTKGQTHIGCYMKGVKDGKERTIYIYNICDHEACYKEVNAQGVSYTTGVPAMIGAKLICEDKWGLNAPKNVAFTQSLRELENSLCDSQDRLVSAEFSTQPTNLKQNLHSLDSNNAESKKVDSTSCHSSEASSIESYNAERLKLNSDMPKGGEEQGIDSSNGSGVWNMEQNDPDPFMCELNQQGLPYIVCEIESNGNLKVLENGRDR
ncbi:saccharopine dehydrogenase family protein [Helicobacter winghamensis]|uniref:Saccharopine dehydrogenase n=1 Tax=Helicobacter winghamensis TaxID=157268 RepID=A0A2N3PJ89_9HELI|nr:saccharopine dehydrogenase family protein [Helicobacter winghamensis]PKT78143.1 saccharopine dehydrogenase [Helicobacter winghamensis]PKT78412.1 saccharopine dehydrogenase [Helicobacter winghamensis]PKT78672.1 saccharopine dehydrogenase [Helicobacter winghamensis]PKT80443.1 saccharopine dehydrogenase [Helicobacter winghamensis]PKT81096.1 saccharopine dehydrogenase [Helicobacter winghamensis]